MEKKRMNTHFSRRAQCLLFWYQSTDAEVLVKLGRLPAKTKAQYNMTSDNFSKAPLSHTSKSCYFCLLLVKLMKMDAKNYSIWIHFIQPFLNKTQSILLSVNSNFWKIFLRFTRLVSIWWSQSESGFYQLHNRISSHDQRDVHTFSFSLGKLKTLNFKFSFSLCHVNTTIPNFPCLLSVT